MQPTIFTTRKIPCLHLLVRSYGCNPFFNILSCTFVCVLHGQYLSVDRGQEWQ
uniref:Uncharacterized protein n=1 Tax=Arundo donax TaxID=35708 RepID=A0A0A9G066_ARUDO